MREMNQKEMERVRKEKKKSICICDKTLHSLMSSHFYVLEVKRREAV
jgi:hypothetical protein